jgi:putative oxidoreductase
MNQLDFGVLLLRLVFGLFFAYHGWNKVFGKGGLSGTASWFGSIGMKWPTWQARLAAGTEIGAGVLLAAGLLTPFAAAGLIGTMVVAIVTTHGKVGFFIFKPGQGWEYCGSIIAAAWAIAAIGPGEVSLDHALDITWAEWFGAWFAPVLGVAAAALQLGVSWRPKATA